MRGIVDPSRACVLAPDQAQSIHSKIQLQSNGNLVNDTATVFGGLQMIRTNCGKQIPLRYVAGLPYLEQRPPTKSELTSNSIPHIIMTAEGIWNPRIVDDHETVEEMIKRFPPTDRSYGLVLYGDWEHRLSLIHI